jgi:hypothetical protein
MFAQTQPTPQELAQQFQPAQALAGGRGGGRGAGIAMPRTEKGKPFSATVTSQTTQVLADGTRLSQTTSMVQYRDSEGRVRTETTQPGASASELTKIITIRDPVAGVTYRLDPAKRTAVKLAMVAVGAVGPAGEGGRGGGGGGRGGAPPSEAARQEIEKQAAIARLELAQTAVAARAGEVAPRAPQPAQPPKANPNEIIDDLGTLSVNGVSARGTRVTTVVPVGAIGNDKEFRSVSERWFSTELNLLIKSVSTDPRFGTTTYELTNITRHSPDPSLFQLPADYTVVTQ